jgi:hypothetical protein
MDGLQDWNALPETLQLALARQAMEVAVRSVAAQAVQLGRQIAAGALPDAGGAEALYLLASLLLEAHAADCGRAGHA